MSAIIYYSNYCEPSKRLLQTVSKTNQCNAIHFICIDNRVKEQNNTYAVLPNGQKMIIPNNVMNVPAMLLLNQGGQVIYGDQIYKHLQASVRQEVKQATRQNMEPMTFQDGYSFGSGGGNYLVTSDSYSFLDADLDVKNGTGGMQQMHQYMALKDSDNYSITNGANVSNENGGKLKDGDITIEQLVERRNNELNHFTSAQPRQMW